MGYFQPIKAGVGNSEVSKSIKMRGKKFIGGSPDTMGFDDLTKFINGSGFKRRELKSV